MSFRIEHINETDSTNYWLREHATTSGEMVVWTDFQTAGRGQGSNRWESERGKNLTFSMLIHPQDVPAERQFVISMAISNAIRLVLQGLTSEAVSIKWPNDIYVGHRKICGILIENRLTGHTIKDCIIGVGLNVNQREFRSDAPNPVSLAQLTGQEYDREALLDDILKAFQQQSLVSPATGSEYRQHLYRREGYHIYCDAAGSFEARMVTVEDDGHLLLCDRNGHERRYAFKEVAFKIVNS